MLSPVCWAGDEGVCSGCWAVGRGGGSAAPWVCRALCRCCDSDGSQTCHVPVPGPALWAHGELPSLPSCRGRRGVSVLRGWSQHGVQVGAALETRAGVSRSCSSDRAAGTRISSYLCGSSFGREPVTTEEAEDYFEVISNPMDFQTMQSKCSCGNYRSVQEFLADMKQVFSNAERYNQNGSHVLSCLEKTEQCLIDMLHKHLPGHTYARRKHKKLSAECQELEEQEGDSESEPLEHSRGRKRKK